MAFRRRYFRRYRRYGRFRRRRSKYFRPYNFTRNLTGVKRRMVRIRKMTKEARALCEQNIEIVSFFTFPLFMKFMGKCYFGHSAIKKLESAIAYLGYQMKYHKKGDGLVGLSDVNTNTRACICPQDSADFRKALGTLFAMSFISSDLMYKIERYCVSAGNTPQTAETQANDINCARAMLQPVRIVAGLKNTLANATSEAISGAVWENLSKFFVIAPWHYNWKNILGNIGDQVPRWNLVGSRWLTGEINNLAVYNVLQEAAEFEQFNPVLGIKVSVNKAEYQEQQTARQLQNQGVRLPNNQPDPNRPHGPTWGEGGLPNQQNLTQGDAPPPEENNGVQGGFPEVRRQMAERHAQNMQAEFTAMLQQMNDQDPETLAQIIQQNFVQNQQQPDT